MSGTRTFCAICGQPIFGVFVTVGVRGICLYDAVQIYESLIVIKKTFKEAQDS